MPSAAVAATPTMEAAATVGAAETGPSAEGVASRRPAVVEPAEGSGMHTRR
jgi:hypothetical protein